MKVMILGVGNAQVDAILYCKEHGYEVYGCSYTDTEKAISLLDHFEKLNIVDKEGVCDYAKHEEIDFVYSVGSDIAMPTACYVSEQLGLPMFVSYETAVICNNKRLMRQTLGGDFEGNVPFVVAATKDDLNQYSDFPGVIKPVDSQGQRGVFKVESLEEARERFDESVAFSKDSMVILEKYLSGREVSVNAYVVDGALEFALVSDRISFDEYPGGIIKEHYIPSAMSREMQGKVVSLADRVIKALNITNGPCYLQVKIDNDVPYLVEVTPRLDGCHMWKLIRFHNGVDLLKATFDHLVGNIPDATWFTEANEKRPVRTVFMCQAPCTTVVDHASYPDALNVTWYYEPGETVRKMNGYMEKCGYRMEETHS